jgi:hypothetical protein
MKFGRGVFSPPRFISKTYLGCFLCILFQLPTENPPFHTESAKFMVAPAVEPLPKLTGLPAYCQAGYRK